MCLKTVLMLSIITIAQFVFSQTTIEWEASRIISPEDFQGTPPQMVEDNMQSYSFDLHMDLSYQMANLQFAFTKNFNSYITAYYTPENSWMESGESTRYLLACANIQFDLAELHARKFRKRIFENKKAASNQNFFNTHYNQVSNEMNDRQSQFMSEMNAAGYDWNAVYLKWDQTINEEINLLSEFCRSCKPIKKRRKK